MPVPAPVACNGAFAMASLIPGAASGARGFYTGMVYDREGRLLATIAQEHVMRKGEFR